MNPDFSPRPVCMRCRRPERVCYCKHLPSIETKTRVVLLQHPRERDVAIGTARMASLCLTNAEIHVGVRWEGSRELESALSDPDHPPALLYPGEGAIDVSLHPPDKPITLIVVDGTWWQAKKLVRENPVLSKLPRYAFQAKSPSEYRIRKEPDVAYVSTIEALAYVLGVLEGDEARFQALLVPFRAMIDSQIECEQEHRGEGSRHAKKVRKEKAPRPPILPGRSGDVVCITGEANAWPYTCKDRIEKYPDELVHWVAERVATGERFDFVVRPTNPLAPRTPSYVGLSEKTLANGGTLGELHAGWRAFVRETDVVCSWGRYATSLFADTGGYLPASRTDLRQAARVHVRGKVGTIEEFLERIAATPERARGGGRGHLRLEQTVAIARVLAGI